jgi:hypothetical protein
MARNRAVPSEERAAKWNLKFSPARIKEVTEEGKPLYLQNAKAAFIDLEQMELGVKQVIDSEGVSPKDVPSYLNVGRQLWKACGKYSGETLKIKAAIVLGRWIADGLAQSVCEAIRTEVFHIDRPTTPLVQPS